MTIKKINAETEQLRAERDLAIQMLAMWVAAVEVKGSDYESWMNQHAAASYRPCAIRQLLDEAIERARKSMIETEGAGK